MLQYNNLKGRIVMPVCPYCNQEITTLYCTLSRNLIWDGGKWVIDMSDNEAVTSCSACYEELGPKDLDKLDVTNILR